MRWCLSCVPSLVKSSNRLLCVIAIGLSAAFALPVMAQENSTVFTTLQMEMHSEPEPIADSRDDWGSRFEAGERQWLQSELEFGIRYRGVELSVERRALADLRLNSEAAEFYGRLSRREPLTQGETVPVHIDINGFAADGLRLGYRYQKARSWVGVSGALLQASHLMSGGLDGSFTATSEQDYDFNALVNYYYYRDPVFGRPDVEKPTGLGWSFRILGHWQVGEHWWLNARADDLLAKIRWKDAPYTDAEAHTNRKRYDEQGFAIFDPLLSGREGYQDRFYQKLDPRYQVTAGFSRGGWSGHVKGRRQFDYSLFGAGGGYRFDENVKLQASVWPALDALDLELEYGRFRLGISMDDVEWQDLKFFNLNLAYGY